MAEDPCSCGSGEPFSACCGIYLDGLALPKTAEALMRSRYSAYVRRQTAYLKETLWPKYQGSFDAEAAAKWAAESHWAGLSILKTEKGGEDDREGIVLFEAKYFAAARLNTHRECSYFRKKGGRWYFVEAIPE